MVASVSLPAAKRPARRLARWAGAALIAASPVAAARAQTAAAASPPDRCEGTLCDLYYSTHTAPAAGAASAAAPAASGLSNWFSRGAGPTNAQPLAPASPGNGYMAMGAGGVLGPKQERCSGTLCDLYYGSSPSSDAGNTQQASTTAVAAPEPIVPRRHIPHESETRPKCSSPTADPWRCYR